MATKWAVTASAALGLDSTTGLVWLGVPDAVTLPRMLIDDVALAARVRALLDASYADAFVLVRRRRAAVERLALALLKRRALDGAEAAAILASLRETRREWRRLPGGPPRRWSGDG